MAAIKGFARLRDLDEGLFGEIEFAMARSVDDPVASVVRQRRFLERLVELARRQCGLGPSFGGALVEDIKEVEVTLKVNQRVAALLHALRRRGNDAAHPGTSPSVHAAHEGLRECHELARWLVALHGRTDLDAFSVEGEPTSLPTARQLRREATRLRKQDSDRRIEEDRLPSVLKPEELVAARPGGSTTARVVDTVPGETLLRWVYFATPTKADRHNTYDLAYEHGVVCCDAHTATGSLKPNVGRLMPGDLLLLAYGERGRYQPQLYLRIDEPDGQAVDRTEVMATLPRSLTAELERVGYRPDPVLKTFTGFHVTPCGEWKGRIREEVTKPTGQNFLRTWTEVRAANGW